MEENFFKLTALLEDLPTHPSEDLPAEVTRLLETDYKYFLSSCHNKNNIPFINDYYTLKKSIYSLEEIENMLHSSTPITHTLTDKENICNSCITRREKEERESHREEREKDLPTFVSCGRRRGEEKREEKDKKREEEKEREGVVDKKMIELIENEIITLRESVEWDDIAGLSSIKKVLNEVIVWPLLRPDIFTGLRGPPRGLLLFGPPGTGKTLIGRCIASQSKSTFFNISASSLTSKWVGEGEKMVRALFYTAVKKHPSVIFIDEIDSLLMQRSEGENEGSRRIKTEFLVQMDGVGRSEGRVLVIGATNRPQEIDEAARRRFVKRLYIPLPSREDRVLMVKRLISDGDRDISDAEFNELSDKIEGYSGSDIFNLCREAAMEPIREIKEIESIREVRKLTAEDFFKALSQIRKSLSEKDVEEYERWNDSYGVTTS